MKINSLIQAVIIITLIQSGLCGQKSTDTYRATAQFSSNQDKIVSVHNINGSITIEGYEGDEVVIEVAQEFSARSKKLLAKAQEDLSVEIVENGNEIVIYFDDSYHHFNTETKSYRNDNKRHFNPGYKYHFDFHIKVPKDSNIEATTLNRGMIEVNNIQASEINANNLNGPISMDNVSGAVYADALNKDIDIVYASNPTEDSYYNTLNGDVTITVLPDFNADVAFKTLNGDMYVDMANTTVRKNLTENVGNKKVVLFKVSKEEFTIGKGGPNLYFDLLNGDATITEKPN